MTELAYEEWPVKSVRLTNLLLDPENPRLRDPHPDNDQRSICHELLEHENVERLARDIANQGYFPTEMMVVIEASKGKYIVLEGNRRAAALKLLANPLFAPATRRSKFEALRKDGAGLIPSKVRVTVAPSRTASRPIILTRHTRTSVERWSPIAQARYIETMVAEGFSPAEIALDMGIQPGNFLRKLREAKLHLLALGVDLDPDVRRITEDPRLFKSTNLQRIMETAEAQQWLGIVPDDKHGWMIKTSTDQFRDAFARIVTDVATGEVHSRNLHTTADVKRYLRTLKGKKPSVRRGRAATATSVAKKKSPSGKPPEPKKPPRVTHTKRLTLLPADQACDLDTPRIHAAIDEIQRLDIARFPNAAAVLYRVLIDMLAAEYLDSTGEMKKLMAANKPKKKRGNDPSWMPSLNQMLRHIVKDHGPQIPGIQASALKALRTFVDDEKSSISLHGLNGFAHNRFEGPDVSQLERIADRLRPLVAVMMQKHRS